LAGHCLFAKNPSPAGTANHERELEAKVDEGTGRQSQKGDNRNKRKEADSGGCKRALISPAMLRAAVCCAVASPAAAAALSETNHGYIN
jgi:hypothetical protein